MWTIEKKTLIEFVFNVNESTYNTNTEKNCKIINKLYDDFKT